MKYFRILLIVCLLAPSMSLAKEVTAEGHGASVEEAVQNAKINATDIAASTFVSSKQELKDGKFKEVLAKYSGGFIINSKVTSVETTNGIFKVVIVANVDTKKINEVIFSKGEINVGNAANTLRGVVDEKVTLTKAWTDLGKVSDPLVLNVVSTKFNVGPDNKVTASHHIEVKWNKKWMDDVKTLSTASWKKPTAESKVLCIENTPGFFVDKFDCKSMYVVPTEDDFMMDIVIGTATIDSKKVELFKVRLDLSRTTLWHRSTATVSGLERSHDIERLPALYLKEDGLDNFTIQHEINITDLEKLQNIELTIN